MIRYNRYNCYRFAFVLALSEAEGYNPRMLRLIARIFYFIGLPVYLILETFFVLILAFCYQIGKLLIKTIPDGLEFPKNKWPRVEVERRQKLIGTGLICLMIFSFWFWFNILRTLPAPEDLVKHPRPLSTHILDRNGELLFKIYRNENRTKLALAQIPPSVQQATIAIEDAEFYNHPGFSLRGILRAAQKIVTRGEVQGGSTITQQLVKNALLTNEKTFTRKIKEVITAVRAEYKYSKNEILEMYLNEVSYGGASYGIEEASRFYFGKGASDLTLAQAALLAGLPGAPSKFSPLANQQAAKERQTLVLDRIAQEGYITLERAAEAKSEELNFVGQKGPIKAPHFVMYVKQLLAETYGEQYIEQGGLTVTTSLDLNLQEQAQNIVSQEVTDLARLRVGNGAAIVTHPGTGEVLAMVGSRDYFDLTRGGNFNVTTASRQPGSSIKPVNYSYALSHGYTPASIIDDSPVTYEGKGSIPYSPKNYDGKFRGRVSLRTALGSSLNVPAVKVLASYGVDKMVEQGKLMGITTWNDPSRFGLSLTLGGGEVKMTDVAVVYGVLANYGRNVPLNPILKVTDSNGKVLEENECGKVSETQNSKSKTQASLIFNILVSTVLAELAPDDQCGNQVLDPRVGFQITDILHDNAARTPTFGPSSLLVIPNHPEVAVKTGTTQNLRDNWAIGYTKDVLVATWVGNNDNTPMSQIASGVTGASPIWHKIIKLVLEGEPSYSWEVPVGIIEGPACGKNEWFLSENHPKIICPTPSPEATSSGSPDAEENGQERGQGPRRDHDNRGQNQE
ncbi:PBP1A family penicillin-binding protein [Candidatus Microgenomates bacterium]|nr:PBP1A family penicillin-binding protein [Candidatus Microgenomates bacterium]